MTVVFIFRFGEKVTKRRIKFNKMSTNIEDVQFINFVLHEDEGSIYRGCPHLSI